jgi:tetratricopeptide (TPR) repeat protein
MAAHIIRVWELTWLRRHAEALAAIAALPEHRDLLFLRAVNLRCLNRVPEALGALEQLERVHPSCSRLFQERGQCHVALRDVAKAVDALVRSVRINPALPGSWQLLQQLTGDPAAAQHLATLNKLPAEVVEAGSLFSDGFLLPAASLIREYLRKDQHNVGAMRLLARIGMENNELAEAESLLESVLKLAPDFHAARLDYAMVLLRRQRYLRVREEAQTLLNHEPDNREFLKLHGAALIGLGDHEPVIGLYERLLTGLPQAGPEVADLRLWRGNALKSTGRPHEAIADYKAALQARPDFAVAWFSLANLKTYRFADEEVARMHSLASDASAPSLDRSYLCFALGKALEDRGEFAHSWEYYSRGNAIVRAGSDYQPEAAEANTRLLRQACTADFFATRAGWGAPDPAPIFIVGLPRSGSTLIEQILASHSQVEGTEELTEIDRYAAELARTAVSHHSGASPKLRPGHQELARALQNLTARDVGRLGELYLAETRAYRKTARPCFIDKMPNNFRHIGLIHLLLPHAKIIDVRREPLACCFGNLKQLFGAGRQEFSYGIEDMARYYRTYLDLMSHWHTVLPGRVLTVHYEDVVEDLEGNVRRILDHCGLPFEPACLSFHETRRSVRSASSEQVRQPLSRAGLHQWRHYEPWLGPLKEALGNAVVTFKLV